MTASTAIGGMRTGSLRRRFARPHGRSRRRRAGLLDHVDVDGFGKIFQARLTHRTQQQPWRGLNCRAKRAGHEDAAGIRHGLEARRDIDAMAIGDGFVKRHLADIEPDAESIGSPSPQTDWSRNSVWI